LIDSNEFQDIRRGLTEIGEEWKNAAFILKETDEDIHTANERRLGVC